MSLPEKESDSRRPVKLCVNLLIAKLLSEDSLSVCSMVHSAQHTPVSLAKAYGLERHSSSVGEGAVVVVVFILLLAPPVAVCAPSAVTTRTVERKLRSFRAVHKLCALSADGVCDGGVQCGQNSNEQTPLYLVG